MTGITRSGIAFLFGFSVHLFRARNIWHTPYGLQDIASSFFSGLIYAIHLVSLLNPIGDSSSSSGGGVEIEAITFEQNNNGIHISEKAKEVVVNYSMIIDILQNMLFIE